MWTEQRPDDQLPTKTTAGINVRTLTTTRLSVLKPYSLPTLATVVSIATHIDTEFLSLHSFSVTDNY